MMELGEWFNSRLPEDWFVEPVTVRCDSEEIMVTGMLPDGVDPKAFRELTREHRVAIAREAESQWMARVTWSVMSEGKEHRYTVVSVPVMTRLRIDERMVLDSLIDGGIARSRSEALAWCVRLVATNEHDWLSELREAAESVAEVRRRGPGGG